MSWKTWIRRFLPTIANCKSSNEGMKARQGTRKLRPVIELLEDRCVPALFSPTTSFSSGGNGPYNLAVADFNGDGHMDIAAADLHTGRGVGVLINNGAGSFTSTYLNTLSTAGYNVTAGDFNGDSRPDIAVTSFSDVKVFLNNGSGGFGAAISTPANAYPIANGDFNEDGKLDIVVGGGGPQVLFGNGNGTFSNSLFLNTPYSFHDFAIADVNADGNLDILGATISSNGVSVHLGNGAGGFTFSGHFVAGGGGSRHVAVGDLNKDGKLDVVTANQDSDTVSVLLGNGLGGFSHFSTAWSGSDGPSSVGIADFDGDSNPDVVVSNRYTNVVSVLRGLGTGHLQAPLTFNSGGSAAKDVVIADFNGDSLPDVAVANINTSTVGILLNTSNTPPVANDGTFAVSEGASAGTAVGTVSANDPNGDPLTYAITSGNTGGAFAIDNSGNITVANPGSLDFESNPTFTLTVQVADNKGASDTATITVNLQNANPSTPSDANGANNSVQEGAANGSTVGITASSSDPNGPAVTYSLSDHAGGRFAIDANTGVVTVADGSLLNYEDATSHSITVVASDGSGGTSSETFTINVADVDPTTPVDSDVAANSVKEGAANGTSVGITASSSDPNGPAVTYSLSDDAGGRFAIDANTGVVTVANGSLLNYESATSHNITVFASDGAGATSSETFTINVANVFEMTGFDVQLGQTQRSYVRYLDVQFTGEAGNLNDVISRLKLTHHGLDGASSTMVSLAGVSYSIVNGDTLRLDFGINGIGGNRNSNLGDGYYKLSLDSDGDGSHETQNSFYRLFGDVTGDQQVTQADVDAIFAAYGTSNAERDVNGDGLVNAMDRTFAVRGLNRKLTGGWILTD